MKFSNKMIQLTFEDDSKLIIDNEETQTVYFLDKNNKKYFYNIHLVNKSNNKRFTNRYEYYKKIFFEKMDERFQKIQQQKEKKEEEMERYRENRERDDFDDKDIELLDNDEDNRRKEFNKSV